MAILLGKDASRLKTETRGDLDAGLLAVKDMWQSCLTWL
jgi:hypothetical protein